MKETRQSTSIPKLKRTIQTNYLEFGIESSSERIDRMKSWLSNIAANSGVLTQGVVLGAERFASTFDDFQYPDVEAEKARW